jgi:hypothetical protein
MKIVAFACNVILFAFTCLVLATDGLPAQAAYIVFTLWALSTHAFSAAVIRRMGTADGWLRLRGRGTAPDGRGRTSSTKSIARIAAVLMNVVLLGFVCWAMADQYPHPEEEGFIPYAVMMAATPAFSLAVFLSGGVRGGRRALVRMRKAS